MKTCCTCKKRLAPEKFNRRSIAKDGLQGQCRKCNNAARIAWHRRDPEKARSYDRARQYSKEVQARSQVQAAVSRGELVKPSSCSECGTKGHVSGHHPDYDRPLYVVWLCRPCHEEAHNVLRGEQVNTA